MPEATPDIELEGVRLALGRRTVLNGVTLAIGPPGGEFVGVLGANGAGKTTLMRAVLGLVPAEAGTVRVLGAPARRGNPAIGYMPQARGAMASMRLRGWDVVASVVNGHRPGLSWMLPWTGRAAATEVDRVLDLVGARALARRLLIETSGGERQRLLLAQALVGCPRLLLLDEPLISLDPHHVADIVDLTRRLQRELGITVLFSAHELNPLLHALDRVLYLGGEGAALGTVDEVITAPVLSRLYGAPIEVVRAAGRIFVMSGQHDMQHDAHRHEGGHEGGHEGAHEGGHGHGGGHGHA